MGGVWFGMQLVLATLGVAVAEKARSHGTRAQNIETANAIEALGCWFAFEGNGWTRDSRLRGVNKLRTRGENLEFARVRQRNFYVTQPMRMATVQALPALGLVATRGGRFNGFSLSSAGEGMVKSASKDYRPYRRDLEDHLMKWVSEPATPLNSPELAEAIKPVRELPGNTRSLLRERILQGGQESASDTERRRRALHWMEEIRSQAGAPGGWERKPGVLADDHWADLRAGARFFAARDAATRVLDVMESHMSNQGAGNAYALTQGAPEAAMAPLAELRKSAERFLDTGHGDREARAMCEECVQSDPAAVLRSLGGRDGRVIRLAGDELRPGPAFRGGSQTLVAQEGVVPEALTLPKGISSRMHNLYLLNLDLHGELGQWLVRNAEEVIQ